MVKCEFCDEEFENKAQMHYHWGEEHEEEINSHQKEKVKKARRKKEEERKEVNAKRKKLAGYSLFGLLSVVVIGLVAYQVIPTLMAGPDQQEEFPLEDRPMLGSEDAEVTVVEFGDYLCPYCMQWEFEVKEQLEQEGYFEEDGGVQFYYLHYPVVDPVGSTNAAVAAECAAEQDHDEFWEFHTALFEVQQEIDYDTASLVNLADSRTDLDLDEFEQCVSNQDTLQTVNNDEGVAVQNEVTGTPTVFINGQRVPNAMDFGQVQSMIDRELQ